MAEGLDALQSGWASLRGWAVAQSAFAQTTWSEAVNRSQPPTPRSAPTSAGAGAGTGATADL